MNEYRKRDIDSQEMYFMIINIDRWNHSSNCTIIKEIKHEVARNDGMPRGVDNDRQSMCLSLSCFMWQFFMVKYLKCYVNVV